MSNYEDTSMQARDVTHSLEQQEQELELLQQQLQEQETLQQQQHEQHLAEQQEMHMHMMQGDEVSHDSIPGDTNVWGSDQDQTDVSSKNHFLDSQVCNICEFFNSRCH